ncbi:MAG: tetratricopeptide repeat protein [Candidatus Omnitrophica bacterium]|nr:tetratricopeptide repeat protein [Candidatus Omnitrophota bacterium]
MKKIGMAWMIFLAAWMPLGFAGTEADPAVTVKELTQKNAKLSRELEDLKSDRNNILKQARFFQKEKADLLAKIEQLKNLTSGAGVELESFKKENAILSGELAKIKAARSKDRELSAEEKTNLERKLKEEKDRSDSLAKIMTEYTPEKINQVLEDRNRLQEENKKMAQKVFEYEKQFEEMKRQMTPLEMDREELHKIVAENKELRQKTSYIQTLEIRQKNLIKENKEYREQIEILKAKFKDAVPGLARASRISQKMMRENAQMHYNLATVFLQNKRYKEAITEYEKALELMPNDPDTHYNLGILYDDFLKDREKSLYHYQRYIAVNPKAPDAKKVEGYVLALELEQKVR